MSLIKDFNDLHIGTKGTVLNIISTVPFFFIITYKFNPPLISTINGNPLIDINFYYIISVCLGLSLMWFFMNFIVTSLSIDVIEWMESINNKESNSKNNSENNIVTEQDEQLKDIFIMTYIYSIGYLAFAIFINIWVGFPFKWMVLSCFGFILFRILWIALWYGVFKKIEKSSNGKVD